MFYLGYILKLKNDIIDLLILVRDELMSYNKIEDTCKVCRKSYFLDKKDQEILLCEPCIVSVANKIKERENCVVIDYIDALQLQDYGSLTRVQA